MRTIAREWAAKFDHATRPYQFALQARAGTDALTAHVRAALATRRDAVLVSVDGRSAYDSMSRAAFLGKLHEVAPELLPFVRMFYGSPSTYCWWDANGCCRDIKQGEGCEQGDALAPALFALGQHDAIHQAATALHPEDSLVAFLDDLYVITTPPRARAALDETVGTVESRCGIASNLGKTRVIGVEAGPPPPGIAELGEDVWRSDKPPAQRGVVVLGSPVGHPAFGSAHPQGPTMPFGRCLLPSPRLTQAHMMPRCGQHCRLSWGGPASKTTVLRGRWPRCRLP